MEKTMKSIPLRREAAAERQAGRCFYCGVLMCRGDLGRFAASFGLSTSLANRLSCTAEHLLARQDGGGDSVSNIAAACLHCNQTRHRLRPPPGPEAYRRIVSQHLRAGQWHRRKVVQAGLLCRPTDTSKRGRPATC
jgi:hypothetical protein